MKVYGTYSERRRMILEALWRMGTVESAARHIGFAQGHYLTRIAPYYGVDVKVECKKVQTRYRLPAYEELLRK